VGAPVAESRAVVLWGLVAAQAAAGGRRASVADVCAVAVAAAGVSGAWVTASGGGSPDFVLSVTGPAGERLAELQLTLGEGPCHDVLAAGAPALAADLADEHTARRWPVFAAEARRAGAGAVFAFPLMIGAIRAGVLGLYRSTPGPLESRQLGDGLILADAATVLLLDSPGHDAADSAGADAEGAGLDGQAPDLALHRAEIDQATGMLTVQLGASAADAFARLRAYAYASDRPLAEVAGDIVARRLRLSPVLPPGGVP
jgi:ANTAR domain/GAF domain